MKVLFENEPYFKLLHLIDSIHLKSRKFIDVRLKTINMTYPQLGMLITLTEGDDISQAEIAEKIGADTTTVMVLCEFPPEAWLVRKGARPKRPPR